MLLNELRIALVAIAKEEDIAIKEWVEYHLKLGFDDIVVFQNDWDCRYRHDNLILHRVDGPNQQVACYNHFIHNMSGSYNWVAFLDLDEFLVLKKHSTIKQFVERYKNPYSISINWVFFGSGGNKHITDDSVLKRFLKRSGSSDWHIKTILNLESGASMIDPHHASVVSFDTNSNRISGPFNQNGPIDVAQINHYYYKSLEEWETKCKRGRADGDWPRNVCEWEQNINGYLDVQDHTAAYFLYGAI